MLKFCDCLVISVLLFVAVYKISVEARPQFISPIEEALSKISEAINDTAVTFIKQLTPDSSKDDKNKSRTRILFRGDLLGDFNDQDIIFPDSYQLITDNIPRIGTTPKCAKGSTFCENLDSYPYQQVQNILHRVKIINNGLFGKDEFLEDRYSITNRNGDFETFICSSIQRIVFPQIAKNKNNKWKYIINQKESDFFQGVRVEYCLKEGSPCDLIGQGVNGYITSCKQKYMLRRMMSLSENGDPIPDSFRMPSACCCAYKKDLSFLTSFGSKESSARNKGKIKS